MARATWTEWEPTVGSGEMYAPTTLDLNTVDIDVNYSFELLEDHDVTIGTAYRGATFDSKDIDISGDVDDSNLLSTFIQDEVTLIPDELFLTTGVRVDEHSEAGSNVAPRAALVWSWEESHSCVDTGSSDDRSN